MKRIELTEEQIRYLRKNYGTKTLEEIARHLCVSAPTVKFRAMELGMEEKRVVTKRNIEWNERQISILVDLYPTTTLSDLSDKIGLSQPTIKKKAIELGLKRADSYDKKQFNNRYVSKYKIG